MKKLLIIPILLLSFLSFSQDYPKIELNDKGQKVVVFTLEQAQKIDNDLEIYALLKVARIKCDSLNLSYVKVIDEQRNQIVLLKSINDQDNKQLIDKDKQIKNLTDQNTNLEKNVKLCDDQKDNDQKEIDGLKKDIKKTKWKSLGGGFLVGVVVTLVTVLLIP
jgi:hypothetical protein